MKTRIILLITLLFSLSVSAQMRNYALDEQMFDYQVKGIGEFMMRFNGEEHLNLDLNFPDSVSQRARDIITVCNADMSRQIPNFQAVLESFINSVSQNNVMLDFTDTAWFAGAECKSQYNKNEISLDLLLTPHEARPGRYCWTLVDVGGPDIIQLADTTKWVAISPTDNELDFIELAGKSKTQRGNFPGFRKPGLDIDYLSAFVALVQAGVISINHCDKITYYFLNVPGFIFTVEFFNRQSANSGWLISSLIPVDDDSKKILYLKSVFKLPKK